MHELLFVDDRPCSPIRPCSFNYELFRRKDVKPILLRVEGESYGESYALLTSSFDQFYVDMSLDQKQEVLRFQKWCKQRGLAPQYFCCMSEPRQEYWQGFARQLGLPAISADTIQALRQKPIMKEWIKKSGLRVAPYAEVAGVHDALAFGQAYGYPIVLKPVDGWGTIFTEVLVRKEDVEQVFHQPFPRRMMVETFIPYREYECCALIYRGDVLDIYPSIMPMPPVAAAHGALNANISVGSELELIPVKNLKGIVQQLVDGFHLETGYLHMEFFASEDGENLIIGELALRYPGCEIAKNHGLAYGFDIAGATLDLYLGRRPNLGYSQHRCVGDLLLPYHAGKIRAVTPKEDIEALPGVIEAHIGIEVGQQLPVTGSASFNCSGWVFVQGDTAAQVESRMQNILNSYQVIV